MRLLLKTRESDGLTLMESLLAAVVLAMAISAITMPFTAAAQNEQDDVRRTLAVGLAQELMEEILSLPFDDPQTETQPGPEPGERTRRQFDNVDDFHGFAEPPGFIADADGRIVDDPVVRRLGRHVEVEYVYVSGQDTGEPPTFVRVIVEVRSGQTVLTQLTRLIYDRG